MIATGMPAGKFVMGSHRNVAQADYTVASACT